MKLKKLPRLAGLLDLPCNILQQIMGELYPREALTVCDIPSRYVPELASLQTSYLTGETTHLGQKTYVVAPRTLVFHQEWLEKFGSNGVNINARKGQCASFLRVSSACYKLAVKHLYSQQFHFGGSAQSCLAFLHDHRRTEHKLKEAFIYLRGHDATSKAPPTNTVAWRRLFNVPVHERIDLERLVLVLGDESWDHMAWKAGAEAVFAQRILNDSNALYNEADDPRSVLQHVARLPGRLIEDRFSVARIRFHLIISGPKLDPQKKAFEKALRKHIASHMAARPDLAKARYGACSEKRLEESCYWKQPGKDTIHC